MIVANYIIAPVYGNIYKSFRPKDITSDQTDWQRETEQLAFLLKILYVHVDTKEGKQNVSRATGYRTILSRFDRTLLELQNLEFYLCATNSVNKQNKQNHHTSLPPPAVFMYLETESKYDQEKNFKT